MGCLPRLGAAEVGDIKRWNPVSSTVTAAPSAVLEKQHGLFRRLYEQTKDIAAEIGEA